MKTVNELSKLSGLSIRALHHYDKIGLLKPAKISEAGYRLYDESSVARLYNILLFRELRFSLREIKEILDSKNFDMKNALNEQIMLLEKEKERLDKIIIHARKILDGEEHMNFDAFDEKKLNEYKQQAKEKWGNTPAYAESEEKTNTKTNRELYGIGEDLMAIFAEIGAMKDLEPSCEEVQAKTEEIKFFITKNFYNCTNEIFYALGQMYVCDERFRNNIDAKGGEGTAEFARRAIEIYCKNNEKAD